MIFRTRRKRPRCTSLIAVINAFGHIRRRFRSKGGVGHRWNFRVVREEGQAMVEYALLLFLIAVVSIAVLTVLGHRVSSLFNEIIVDL